MGLQEGSCLLQAWGCRQAGLHGTGLPSWWTPGWMDSQLPPTHPDANRMLVVLSNPLHLPHSSPSLPLSPGDRSSTRKDSLYPSAKVSRDFEIRLEHLTSAWSQALPGGCGAARGALGQQKHCSEGPWGCAKGQEGGEDVWGAW